MADVDIDPFGEHDRTELRTDEPMDEHIPLTPVGPGGALLRVGGRSNVEESLKELVS